MSKTWQSLNRVTTLSKVIAAVLFVTLPFFAFWIGYDYGNSIGMATQAMQSFSEHFNAPLNTKLPLTPPPTVVSTAVCIFTIDPVAGYGANKVTMSEKSQICEFFRVYNSTGYDRWNILSIFGKEGNHIIVGQENPCMLELNSNQVKMIYCQGDVVRCEQIDGLNVTHLLSTCFDTTTSKQRNTK